MTTAMDEVVERIRQMQEQGSTILEIDSLDLETLPALPANVTHLNCSFNRLTKLPQLPDGLRELICFDNQLQELPTLPSGLKELICFNNQLQQLPVLPNGLEKLYCFSNQLRTLPRLPLSLIPQETIENGLRITETTLFIGENPFIEPFATFENIFNTANNTVQFIQSVNQYLYNEARGRSRTLGRLRQVLNPRTEPTSVDREVLEQLLYTGPLGEYFSGVEQRAEPGTTFGNLTQIQYDEPGVRTHEVQAFLKEHINRAMKPHRNPGGGKRKTKRGKKMGRKTRKQK